MEPINPYDLSSARRNAPASLRQSALSSEQRIVKPGFEIKWTEPMNPTEWTTEMGMLEIQWIEGEPKELRAGMLLKCKYPHPEEETNVYLVGDVNDLGGYLCDCCRLRQPRIAYSTSLVGLVNSVKGVK